MRRKCVQKTVSHRSLTYLFTKCSQYAHTKREKKKEKREGGEAFGRELRAEHARLEIPERLPDCSLPVCFLPVLPRCIPNACSLIGRTVAIQYGG